jgi:hypothetical protein
MPRTEVAARAAAMETATLAAVATAKTLRGDDPEEVTRLCGLLDERCGLPPSMWEAMLAGLRKRGPRKSDSGGASTRKDEGLPAEAASSETRSTPPTVPPLLDPDPTIPWWQR